MQKGGNAKGDIVTSFPQKGPVGRRLAESLASEAGHVSAGWIPDPRRWRSCGSSRRCQTVRRAGCCVAGASVPLPSAAHFTNSSQFAGRGTGRDGETAWPMAPATTASSTRPRFQPEVPDSHEGHCVQCSAGPLAGARLLEWERHGSVPARRGRWSDSAGDSVGHERSTTSPSTHLGRRRCTATRRGENDWASNKRTEPAWARGAARLAAAGRKRGSPRLCERSVPGDFHRSRTW